MANRQNNQTKMLNQPTDWIFCQPLPLISSSSSATPPPPSSTPSRRPSKTSNGSSAARRRNSLKRLSVRTRFGRAPPPPPSPILSKAAQSLQVVRDDLAKMTASHFVKPISTISTQTIEKDEVLFSGSAVSVATSKRQSRIPVRLDRCRRDKEQKGQKTAPPGAVNAPPTPAPPTTTAQPTPPPRELRCSFSRCNIFSVETAPIFEVQLQLIDSLSDRTVSVKPSVARRPTASYVVSEAKVLACPEIKSRTIDVDSTLEDWRPSVAELSVVTGPKTNQKRKSIVKTTSKSSSKTKDRDASRKGKESSPTSGKSSDDDESFVVDDPDKVKRTRTSVKRSNSKAGTSDRNDAKSNAHDDTNDDEGGGGGKAGESDLQGEPTTATATAAAAINNRVHFSPLLTSSGGGQSKVEVGAKADTSSSPVEGKAASSSEDLGLVQRVTDQALNSIAKSVMLSLQRRYPSYDVKNSTSVSSNSYSGSYRPTKTSFNSNSNSFQSSRPIFSLANYNYDYDDDDDDDQYSAYRRNPSHSSASSLFTGTRARYGLSTTSLYDVYRPTTVPLSKTRKELDNRYSHSNIWRSSSSTANGWFYDGSYAGHYDDMQYRVNAHPGGCGCGGTANARQRPTGGMPIASSSSSAHYFQEPLRYSKPSDRFSVRSSSGVVVAGEGLMQTTAFPRPSTLRLGKMDGEEVRRASTTTVVASYPTDFHNKSSRGVQTM